MQPPPQSPPSGAAPRVSVLIPTYNYARYLPEAIESVLAQDFRDFELLISDDGSTDGSDRIILDYAARDPRIRAVCQPQNLGMVAHWNWCLREARGECVKFLFGDDRLAGTHALRTLVGLLDAHPNAVMAASARYILDEQSNAIAIWDELKKPGLHQGTSLTARCLSRNLIGEPSVVLFRRSAATRGFDLNYRQIVDLEMWLHLLRAGDLAFTPEPLCGFRQHAQQQTVANSRERIGPQESLRLLSSYLEHIAPPPHAGALVPSLRATIWQNLYYSRKHAPRTPEMIELEERLRARMSAFWYRLYWLQHRLTKPFQNLWRARHKLSRTRQFPPGVRPLAAAGLK